MIADPLAWRAQKGTAPIAQIRDEIRASPVVHADETNWREDGGNGDPWLIATRTARSCEAGRGTGTTIDEILGASVAGTLVTAVSGAADHFLGEKPCCWAHLLRDVKELPAQAPEDRELAQGMRQPDRAARDRPPNSERFHRAKRRRLEVQTLQLGAPDPERAVPQKTLCKWIGQHLSELDTFVTDPRVPRPQTEPSARSARS